jgi:glycosyltransferase involved in cell wall biosynthesis
MIDPDKPDYQNTPASQTRPHFQYGSNSDFENPDVSIITPYYNTGSVFQETILSVQRMSFTNWEWIIVDDGSTDPKSLEQLKQLGQMDPRVRIMSQENAGPSAARNTAVAQARARYLFQIDSDDLVEPTFLEKCLWFLETHPDFAFCNSWSLGMGNQEYLWSIGFERGADFLNENWVPPTAVIRRDAHIAMGGYDETIRYGHEDWDYWLGHAAHGQWGYTIQEYLFWYRRQKDSRIGETQKDRRREAAFRSLLTYKYADLGSQFPSPKRIFEKPFTDLTFEQPFRNLLHKSSEKPRILCLYPWLTMGGADKFNLDMIRWMPSYEFTIVTTLPVYHPWLSQFAAYTPDTFCLDRFLDFADYPRFISYLMQSRQIDAVLISNSELGYQMLPYLRSHHPHVALLDLTHIMEPYWKNGGYPVMSLDAQPFLERSIVTSINLKEWMVKHGVDANYVEVCYTNIDIEEWNPRNFDPALIRQRLNIPPDLPILLFAGRLVAQKRPRLLAEIVQHLAGCNLAFICLVAGAGEETLFLQRFAATLPTYIRLLGRCSNDEIRQLLAAADILLLPSLAEGLALVLYEALAMETVPVAADVGGHRELVTPDCGVLIPQGSNELAAYVDTIQQLCLDPALRSQMGKAGRRRVVNNFSRQQFVMPDILSSVIASSKIERCAPVDTQFGRFSVKTAMTLARMEHVADILWNRQVSSTPQIVQDWKLAARTVREHFLPIYTRRYRIYRAFRLILRRFGIG